MSSASSDPAVISAEPVGGIQNLPIADVRAEHSMQARVEMDRDHVRDLADKLEGGAIFPPLEVVFDGEYFWLWDGFHRLDAYRANGIDEVPCSVRDGTRQDAVKLAAGANEDHGKKRTADDKRRAVIILLDEFPDLSARSIADLARVSDPFVGKVKKSRTSSGANVSTSTGGKVTGRDGKKYNAQAPAPEPSEPGAPSEPSPSAPKSTRVSLVSDPSVALAAPPAPVVTSGEPWAEYNAKLDVAVALAKQLREALRDALDVEGKDIRSPWAVSQSWMGTIGPVVDLIAHVEGAKIVGLKPDGTSPMTAQQSKALDSLRKSKKGGSR